MSEYLEISVREIATSPTNPRKKFDPVKLQELSDSIRAKGVLQPLLVREIRIGHEAYAKGFTYELVAGERRFRAAKQAGLETVPAIVRPLSNTEVIEIQAVENDQREDVLPSERARGYHQLIKLGRTREQIAERIGKSEAWVRMYLQLIDLPEEFLDATDAGIIPPETARYVARVPNADTRENVAKLVMLGIRHPSNPMKVTEKKRPDAEPLTSRQTRELIQDFYIRELKGAPFDQKDESLPPGSCMKCPKRAGNAGSDYASIRADMCLDVCCFRDKARLSMERELNSPPAANVTYMPKGEAKKTIQNGYVYSSTLVDLNGRLSYHLRHLLLDQDPKLSEITVAKLIGARTKDLPIVVAFSEDGLHRFELVKIADVEKIILDLYPPQKSKPAKSESREPSDFAVRTLAESDMIADLANAMVDHHEEFCEEIGSVVFAGLLSTKCWQLDKFPEIRDHLKQFSWLSDPAPTQLKEFAVAARELSLSNLLRFILQLSLSEFMDSGDEHAAVDDLAQDYNSESFETHRERALRVLKDAMKKPKKQKAK